MQARANFFQKKVYFPTKNHHPTSRCLLLERDAAVVGVVGQRINNHGENHNDVLASFLHREEGDNVIGKALPSHSLKQNPANAQLQGKTHQESANEKQQFTPQVVFRLEYPVAVPQETVDNAQYIARDIGDSIG